MSRGRNISWQYKAAPILFAPLYPAPILFFSLRVFPAPLFLATLNGTQLVAEADPNRLRHLAAHERRWCTRWKDGYLLLRCCLREL